MDAGEGNWAGNPLLFQPLHATYSLSDGNRGNIIIRNVTDRGMGCHYGDARITIGDEINIELPLIGPQRGIVRWSKDGRCGLEMLQPIDVDCLTLYSQMINSVGEGH